MKNLPFDIKKTSQIVVFIGIQANRMQNLSIQS